MADVYTPQECFGPSALFERLRQELPQGPSHLRKARLQFHSDTLPQLTLWTAARSGHRPPADAVDLATGLAQVLVRMVPRHDGAAKSREQMLYVSAASALPDVAAMLRRLEIYATPSRVACCQRDGGDVWLTHVHSDRRRVSGLSALRSVGEFRGWTELACYEHQDLCVFLPAELSPSGELLSGFCELLRDGAMAEALGLHPQGPHDERFYIVHPPWSRDGRFEVLTLPPRSFVDSTEIGSVARTARVVALTPAVSRPRLLALLAQEAPEQGYRLTLRTTKRREDADAELRELWSRQAALEQEIAYLESVKAPHPYLLRFTHAQLPALARTIYSFRADALFDSDTAVRYAFQATEHEPAGFHYLLVEPGAARIMADPLIMCGPASRIRFWLDPSWGRHYHDIEGNRAYVFVPEQTALFPSLHTWSIKQMDAHLEAVLARPARAALGSAYAPDHAYVYVFDASDDSGEALDVTVLERAAFQPVGHHFNWLCDNLTVAARWQPPEPVSKSAAAIRWNRAARRFRAQAAASVRALRATARRTADQYVGDFDALLQQIEQETAALLERSAEAQGTMSALDEQLHAVIDIPRRQRDLAEVRALVQGVATAARSLSDRLHSAEEQLVQSVREVERVRDGEARTLRELLQSLRDTRAALLAELRSPRRPRE